MNGGYSFISDDHYVLNENQNQIEKEKEKKKAKENEKEVEKENEKEVEKEKVINNDNTFSQELGLIMVGALIFIVSFMWKDFITDFQHVFLSDNPSLVARFLYTLIVSIFVVNIIVFIRNYLKLSRHSFFPSFGDVPYSSGSDREIIIDN